MTSLNSPDFQSNYNCYTHISRMDEICVPCRLMYMQQNRLRRVGKRHARFKDKVGKDVRMLGIRSWWAKAMNQEECRELLKKSKTLL
jgi:hypothetical protein